jgi:hypothetical protein
MDKLRLRDGHFDIAVSDGSEVRVNDVISRSGFYIAAPDSNVLVQNSDLGVGRFSDYWNRIVFPGHTVFKNCRFTLRPELAPQQGEVGKWAAIHVFWNIVGTAYQNQVLEFLNCDFEVGKEVPSQDVTYAFFIGRYAAVDDENTLNLKTCRINRRYDYGLYSTSAARMNIQNSRIHATHPFYLSH